MLVSNCGLPEALSHGVPWTFGEKAACFGSFFHGLKPVATMLFISIYLTREFLLCDSAPFAVCFFAFSLFTFQRFVLVLRFFVAGCLLLN